MRQDDGMTQTQILARWRSLLGGAKALVKLGYTDAAVRRISDLEFELFMAQALGLPCDEAICPANTESADDPG